MSLVIVQEALSDSRKLSGRLKSIDATAESLIARASQLEKSIDKMREYSGDLECLSSSYGKASTSQSNNNNQSYIMHQSSQVNQSQASQQQQQPSQASRGAGARSTIVANLQRESRQLKALERENLELRMALEDHQNTLELIMSKYRSQMSQLIKSNSVLATTSATHMINSVDNHNSCNCHHLSSSNQLIQMYQQKVNDMVAVMMRAIDLDEANDAKKAEQLAQLTTENKGLKELLSIARTSNSITLGSNVSSKSTVTKSTQTRADDIETDSLSTPYILTTALDSMSISSDSTSCESQSQSPNALCIQTSDSLVTNHSDEMNCNSMATHQPKQVTSEMKDETCNRKNISHEPSNISEKSEAKLS